MVHEALAEGGAKTSLQSNDKAKDVAISAEELKEEKDEDLPDFLNDLPDAEDGPAKASDSEIDRKASSAEHTQEFKVEKEAEAKAGSKKEEPEPKPEDKKEHNDGDGDDMDKYLDEDLLGLMDQKLELVPAKNRRRTARTPSRTSGSRSRPLSEFVI